MAISPQALGPFRPLAWFVRPAATTVRRIAHAGLVALGVGGIGGFSAVNLGALAGALDETRYLLMAGLCLAALLTAITCCPRCHPHGSAPKAAGPAPAPARSRSMLPMPSAGEGCRPETLFQNRIAHVQRCVHCGCVSLHVGPMTMRLNETGLEDLWRALGEANHKLRARDRAQWDA